MKITGTNSYVKFDLENGYVLKAEGEMLLDRKFAVYKKSMKFWEPPHEKEKLTETEILNIIEQVNKRINENTVQIVFD